MRVSTLLLSVCLFGLNAGLIYLWFFDTQEDLSQAKTQIQTQAFESIKKKVVEEQKLDTRLNPQLEKQFKTKPAPIKTQLASAPEPKSVEPILEEVFVRFAEEPGAEGRLWCRPSSPKVLSFPARCVYQGGCFSCDDSEIIQPDTPEAKPFCTNGSLARQFDAECCPSGFSTTEYTCPDMPTCLAAEAVPTNGCTCGGSTDCRYNPVTTQPGCECH